MLRRGPVNSIAGITLALLTISSFIVEVPWWSFLFIVIVWFLITLCGSFFIRWNYHLTSLHSNKKINKQEVAITFDDGPHPEFTPKALDLLKNYNAKATFFCIGQQVEKHPEILKRILAEGHLVGNHTYSHSKSFGFFNTAKVVSELLQTNQVIKDLTGKEMKLYRPAFAVTNPMIERAVKQLKVSSIGWNVRSLDTTSRSEKMILKRITGTVSKGDVILLHDTSQKTINVLEQLLLFLQEKNLESVTIDQLLEIEAYE
ncbi:polysaccharide deacetylase family protein [Maribacter sp. 2308TA10-17]|uniref:polysaccharide deacetylase family protein n=1 Tax=Maribacter sp. 2308TA10-17 TaxID=3386276 RepID=UPI0039BC69F0